MDDATLQKVCTLDGALRQSAHLLLSRKHKLSLDTWSLCEIQEAFSLILEVEQHTNFHVLPANHRQHPAIPHLQFIYDLLQKIYGLRLWARHGAVLPPEQVVSLRCFRSLQALELDHTPVSCLKGLQNLRPNLKSIIAVKCIHQLSDLFIRCGADKAGEFAWQELEIAVLSHNNLTTLDQSLRLLPNLQVLDLSHCCLEDGSSLEFLPRITYLDLSHNHLTILPRLSPTAAKTITVILVNNNLISHIGGLDEYQGLEEVDLRDNVLSLQEVLTPLSLLPKLQTLGLKGNPLACDQNYRMHAVRRLNPQLTNHKVFLVDGDFRVFAETTPCMQSASSKPPYKRGCVIALFSCWANCQPTCPYSGNPSGPTMMLQLEDPRDTIAQTLDADTSHPASVIEETISSSVKSTGNIKKKSRKSHIRHITIADSGDEEEDSDGIQPIPENDSLLSKDITPMHTILLENDPSTPPPSLAVGSDFSSLNIDSLANALNVLQVKNDNKSSETEQSDKLLDEILQDKNTSFISECKIAEVVTENSEDEDLTPAQTTLSLPEDKKNETFFGGKIPTHDSSYNIAAASNFPENKDFMTVLNYAISGGFSHNFYRSPEIFLHRYSDVHKKLSESNDDEKDEEEIYRLLARREINDDTNEKPHAFDSDDSNSSDANATFESGCAEGKKLIDIILAVTKQHFKEKHHITTRTLYRWELSIIESLEVLSTTPYKVLLTFSTIRPAFKSRTYILDESDYQILRYQTISVIPRIIFYKI
ncbi:unnamed protein product, partial [Meganyctiphanes norvegica]